MLDPSVLALATFDRGGVIVTVRLLPEPFRTSLLGRRREEMTAWGPKAATFDDTPATKRIPLSSDGRLLVLFPLPHHWGLLIDPRHGSARPLPLPADPRTREILWAARGGR